jgi:hypothetical protein
MTRKAILSIFAAGLLLTGCSNDVSDSSTTETSITDTASVGESSIVEYTRVYWTDLPTSMSESFDLSEKNVEIIGYLSSSISNDKSTAYMFNTHVDLTGKDFYSLDESAGIKMVSLDLQNIVNYDNKTEYDDKNLTAVEISDGLQFVKVKGKIIKNESTDVFANKREWYLKVDSIEITEDIGSVVKEYEEFANSNEFEALSNSLNYAGDILYNLANDEDYTLDSDTDTNEYDIVETVKGIAENYPEIYSETEEDLKELERLVLNVEDKNDTVGTSGNDYDTLYDAYTSFVLNINQLGMLA